MEIAGDPFQTPWALGDCTAQDWHPGDYIPARCNCLVTTPTFGRIRRTRYIAADARACVFEMAPNATSAIPRTARKPPKKMKVALLSIRLLPPMIPAPWDAQPIPTSRSITPMTIGIALLIFPSSFGRLADILGVVRNLNIQARLAEQSREVGPYSHSSRWAIDWCGRWDSNPRTPKGLEPQSNAVGHAGRLPRECGWFFEALKCFRELSGPTSRWPLFRTRGLGLMTRRSRRPRRGSRRHFWRAPLLAGGPPCSRSPG